MFRKTTKEKQMDPFYSPGNLPGKRSFKKHDGSKAWQNIFHKEVTSRIDKNTFSVLFHSTGEAPIASVGGMIL